MMEQAHELYSKFKIFLRGFFIRRVKGEFEADDFDEEKTAYIRPHLEELLPTLTLTEAARIRVYFNDLFIYHLTDQMGKPTLPARSPLSPIPNFEGDAVPPDPKRPKTQSQSEEISGLSSSQTEAQQKTPLETLDPAQRRKTVPLMQSTPLSAPLAVGGDFAVMTEQQRLDRAQEDDFIADIISQINLSPIPQASVPQAPRENNQETSAQPEATLSLIAAQDEIPFLRGFGDILQKMSSKRKRSQVRYTPRTTRDRLLTVEPVMSQPKIKKKRKDFEALCCLAQKQKTEEQIRRAEQSFLYFSLLPGKTRTLIKRVLNNVVVPEGGRGHIPMQRIINLSNVMRAHASQKQSSIEQPGQISLLNMLRSPCTPQGLLRTSQLQPFTPIRGEVSGQSPGMETDQISNFPMRSVLRQQPLLTIPERDSSILIPQSPQLEVIYSSIPIPNSLQLDEIPFNNSVISVPQLAENISTIPLNIGEDLASVSNLPRMIPEDIDMIDVQSQITQGVVSAENAVAPMQLDEFDSQVQVIPQNEVGSQADAHGDNAPFSWFEILRPREDVVYPQVDGERRRKKKKRKRKREEERDVQPRRILELPEIPRSPDRSNFPNLPVLPDEFAQQVTQIPTENYSEENESEFDGYFNLIKEAGANPEYRTWERFDPYLFSESDDFEMYTYIFKRIIKDDYVAMDTLYAEGTTRLEAAKGFRLILDLRTMGIIEIDSVDTRIVGFRFKTI